MLPWLRCRKLQLCSIAFARLSFQDCSAASLRRECSSAGRNVGRLKYSCYASTGRWMCTTNARMLNSNANCTKTPSLERGDADLRKPSLSYKKDIERKSSNRLSSEWTSESADKARKIGHAVQHTSLIQDGDYVGDEAIERSDESDVEVGEESEQLESYGQTMGRKVPSPLEPRTEKELAKHLAEKGWSESTNGFLFEKLSQQELSFFVVSRVISNLKDVKLASSLFQWVCEHMGHDVSVYHASLSSLGKAKRFHEMWNLLTKMKAHGIEVSFIAFCIMIRACRIARVPAMAVEVFKRAPDYGIELNVDLHQELLMSLFLLNLVGDARLLYSSMIRQGMSFNIRIFNTLINGFGLTSGIEDVKKSFDVLLKSGIRPTIRSYRALIYAYCNVHAIDKAVLAFFEIGGTYLRAHATEMNIIVEAMCKERKFDDAIKFIDRVQAWCFLNTRTFNIILNGLLSCKQVSKAIDVFQLMEEEGHTNQWTYTYLMNGLRQCPQTKEIQGLLKGLFTKYGYGSAKVCYALLYNLASRGETDEAEGLFKGIVLAEVNPSLPAYTTMISFYCRLKMPDRALQLLLELKDRGVKPNAFCYTPIIDALLDASRIADAKKCFQEMVNHGCESSAAIQNQLLTEVCRLGMVADVPEILSSMLRTKSIMQSSAFFQFAKCMAKAGKIKQTNILCRSLYELEYLELCREAAQQVFGVMKVMSMAS
ncbi:hypothetical protein GOP47_0012054 [Adiantum capillus-veneris]|uniref:Pentatricopeptide repeat-containing protein n=1 Tax=Adiantum capillus-veneris TaxID=13818 RepID=A0A9D4UUC2_ADICA|nr:hypothetical protein GOP47_0012054 [Adiantum capillus-veneris]